MLLSGCNTLKERVYPYSPNEAVKLNKNQAIVLLGDKTSYRWVELESLSARYDLDDVSEHILALPVKIGSTFSVKKMKEVSYNNSTYRYVKFSKQAMLKIDKSGIYYYGTLISRYSTEKQDIVLGYAPYDVKNFITTAKKKYPSIFKQLPNINF